MMGKGLTLVTTIITVVGTISAAVLAPLVAAYFQYYYGERNIKGEILEAPSQSTKIGNIISTEQWGHPGEGTPFDHQSNEGIKRIVIHCGWVIDTIDVQYRNNGQLQWSTYKIGRKGGRPQEIVLDDDEYLTEVKGFYGRLFGMNTINSLTFVSNKGKRFGRYGIDKGTPREEVEAEPTPFHVKEGKIVGFHGIEGKRFLSAIGFYTAPVESVEAPSIKIV